MGKTIFSKGVVKNPHLATLVQTVEMDTREPTDI